MLFLPWIKSIWTSQKRIKESSAFVQPRTVEHWRDYVNLFPSSLTTCKSYENRWIFIYKNCNWLHEEGHLCSHAVWSTWEPAAWIFKMLIDIIDVQSHISPAAPTTERLLSISNVGGVRHRASFLYQWGVGQLVGCLQGKFVTPGVTNLQCEGINPATRMNCQYFWVFFYENHIFNATMYHNNLKPRHQVGEDRGRNESLHELLFERRFRDHAQVFQWASKPDTRQLSRNMIF